MSQNMYCCVYAYYGIACKFSLPSLGEGLGVGVCLPLSQPRYRYIQLLSVFRNRATGYREALFFHQFGQCLIAERLTFILFFDDSFQCNLNLPR